MEISAGPAGRTGSSGDGEGDRVLRGSAELPKSGPPLHNSVHATHVLLWTTNRDSLGLVAHSGASKEVPEGWKDFVTVSLPVGPPGVGKAQDYWQSVEGHELQGNGHSDLTPEALWVGLQ